MEKQLGKNKRKTRNRSSKPEASQCGEERGKPQNKFHIEGGRGQVCIQEVVEKLPGLSLENPEVSWCKRKSALSFTLTKEFCTVRGID